MILKISLSIVIAYLLGSIPTSYIFGRILKKIDIRNFGSGNVGATNALRILGWKTGLVVMILDAFKGYISLTIARKLLVDSSGNMPIVLVFVGMAAIAGHIFTIFLSFKGGKGVSTSAGVFLNLATLPLLAALIVFIITVWITRYVSFGSILATITLFVGELFVNIFNGYMELEILILTFLISLFIIVKHKTNIERLIKGNENKISFKPSSQKKI